MGLELKMMTTEKLIKRQSKNNSVRVRIIYGNKCDGRLDDTRKVVPFQAAKE